MHSKSLTIVAVCWGVVGLLATASDAQVTVTSNALDIWKLDGGGYGSPASFAPAPANNAYGESSLLLTTTSPNSATNITTNAFDGILVRDLTSLAYSTFVTRGSAKPGVVATDSDFAPYLNLYLDADGDGVQDGARDTTLIYEPYLSGPNAPLVSYSSWQRWDALNGTWWALRGQWNGSQFTGFGRDYRTLSEWLTVLNASSSAKIVSNQFNTFRIQVGAGLDDPGWQNRVMYADGLSIGFYGNTPVTYNFELAAAAPDPSSLNFVLASTLSIIAIAARRRSSQQCVPQGCDEY